jgi:hypothetical protein
MVGKADVGPKRSSGRIQWAIFAKPHSYMWFLIASEQITQTKKHNKSMTMDQLLEAEQRAADWMRKTMRIPPSSSPDSPEDQPSSAKGASGT